MCKKRGISKRVHDDLREKYGGVQKRVRGSEKFNYVILHNSISFQIIQSSYMVRANRDILYYITRKSENINTDKINKR